MGGDALVPAYRYVINGLAFAVSKAGYDALDERLTYRVYYTARGRKLLNIEPLGDDAAG
jgi:hypothetical protein